MKKVYLLPVFLFLGCIPDDFKIDDNIYNSKLEEFHFYENQNAVLESQREDLTKRNDELSKVINFDKVV